MFNWLIDIGATFDWITPMIDFFKNAKNGSRHSFFVDRYVGWSANDIERMLKQSGIEMWGIVFFKESIAFDVKESQALQTQYLLQQNGLPILQGAVAAYHLRSRKKQAKRAPAAKKKQAGIWQDFDQWLDDLAGFLGV